MGKFVTKWLLFVAAIILAAIITSTLQLPFRVDVSSFAAFIKLCIGAAILGFLNSTIGALLKFLSLPLNCLTFGLVSLVINAAMLEIAGNLNFGFQVGSFWAALVGSVFISILNTALTTLVLKEKDD